MTRKCSMKLFHRVFQKSYGYGIPVVIVTPFSALRGATEVTQVLLAAGAEASCAEGGAIHFNRIELFNLFDRSVTSGVLVRIPPLHSTNETPGKTLLSKR